MRRRLMTLALGSALVLAALLAGSPRLTSACSPALAPEFAALKAQLGALMGEPTDCPRAEAASGDLLQPTTTGFAYRHAADGPASFTTGREFWALMPAGVEHWTGSAHLGFAPPSLNPAPAGEAAVGPVPAPGTYPAVEAVTAVEAPDAAAQALLVQGAGGRSLLALAPGCADIAPATGQTLFLRSPDPATGAPAELIALGGGGRCPIAARRAP